VVVNHENFIGLRYLLQLTRRLVVVGRRAEQTRRSFFLAILRRAKEAHHPEDCAKPGPEQQHQSKCGKRGSTEGGGTVGREIDFQSRPRQR
jgi:hypothetical protein